jgi:hypothetical protein
MPSLENSEQIFPAMHTEAITAGLGLRKGELVRLPNYRERIQESVLRKMQLGMSYDASWESVKREHPGWFE